jgi:hypothetical protein
MPNGHGSRKILPRLKSKIADNPLLRNLLHKISDQQNAYSASFCASNQAKPNRRHDSNKQRPSRKAAGKSPFRTEKQWQRTTN